MKIITGGRKGEGRGGERRREEGREGDWEGRRQAGSDLVPTLISGWKVHRVPV